MKAILISIKPKWCALMMNGEKTIEVRRGTALYKAIKKLIDEYGYADIYVYCTKDTINLLHKNVINIYWVEDKDFMATNKKLGIKTQPYLNGKVIFKFRCYNVEELKTCERHSAELVNQSCLTANEFYDYLTKGKNFLGSVLGCAIHISDLEIFDKPKELREFTYWKKYEDCEQTMKLTKAPQSYMFIEVE